MKSYIKIISKVILIIIIFISFQGLLCLYLSVMFWDVKNITNYINFLQRMVNDGFYYRWFICISIMICIANYIYLKTK